MSDDTTFYDLVGGHPAVVRLVDRFYTHMDTLPEAAGIRALHDDDLTGDRHKLAAFLSGWLGGPPLYWQEYGHPRLRQRHMHLPIDRAAARAWLLCMGRALDEVVEDPRLARHLLERFATVADHLRNVEEPPEG
ncbi:MAG: group II truncated hemoglobin [Alphaproteobacteria bacterium]|nr:group II truncated hemoglobin [Alphaproteobacteria bacterium]